MYSQQIWDHFRNPRNRGEMSEPDAQGDAYYHRCGDKMRLMFRISEGRLSEVKFLAHGCGPAVAAASVATTLLTGRTLEEARELTAFELHDALGGMPASKRHSLLMVLECLSEALGSRHQLAQPDN